MSVLEEFIMYLHQYMTVPLLYQLVSVSIGVVVACVFLFRVITYSINHVHTVLHWGEERHPRKQKICGDSSSRVEDVGFSVDQSTSTASCLYSHLESRDVSRVQSSALDISNSSWSRVCHGNTQVAALYDTCNTSSVLRECLESSFHVDQLNYFSSMESLPSCDCSSGRCHLQHRDDVAMMSSGMGQHDHHDYQDDESSRLRHQSESSTSTMSIDSDYHNATLDGFIWDYQSDLAGHKNTSFLGYRPENDKMPAPSPYPIHVDHNGYLHPDYSPAAVMADICLDDSMTELDRVAMEWSFEYLNNSANNVLSQYSHQESVLGGI